MSKSGISFGLTHKLNTKMKTFQALVESFVFCLIGQFISLMVLMLLFKDVYSVVYFWLILINFFYAFIIALLVFIPIAYYDKEKIKNSDFKTLIRRYLPILSVPFAIALICLFSSEDINHVKDEWRYVYQSNPNSFLLIMVLNLFCSSYTGLYAFIRRLKS